MDTLLFYQFTVNDINSTVTKLMALGAELDGPIKYEVNAKVLSPFFLHPSVILTLSFIVN